MLTDLPLSELRHYRSSQTRPTDFDDFWSDTLSQSRTFDIGLTLHEVQNPLLRSIRVFDVTFSGYGGQPIKAWLRVPAEREQALPAIVQYVGYGGGRGHPHESLLWAAAGYAHLHMDSRGQGSTWSIGHTADDAASGPQSPGFMTRGISSRETYYYRRIITDAVRALDATAAIPFVDPDQIAVLGGSQGAGIALAVAALAPSVKALFARVPFLCDFPRALDTTDRPPYSEISQYLAIHRHETDAVMEILSYFDGVNFASTTTVPAWFSVGLTDRTSPPSTVFGAYNAYRGPKNMAVWHHNGHEAGAADDDLMTLETMSRLFPRPTHPCNEEGSHA